jgi:hypothetical protein
MMEIRKGYIYLVKQKIRDHLENLDVDESIRRIRRYLLGRPIALCNPLDVDISFKALSTHHHVGEGCVHV